MLAQQPAETTTRGAARRSRAADRAIRFTPSPINRRRWQNFKANRRGYWSFWIFLVLFVVSLFAELIANDKPFYVALRWPFYFPAFVSYPETAFGGDFETAADYRDPYLQKLIADKGGFMLWPPIRYSYDTHNLDLPTPAPSKPTWMLTRSAVQSRRRQEGAARLPRPRIQLARHRRSGPRRRRAADLRLPHLGAVRPEPHDHLVDHRHRGRRRAGLFRRLARPRISALHRSLDARSRRCIFC